MGSTKKSDPFSNNIKSGTFVLTIKNYKVKGGLSNEFHNTHPKDFFYAKGPMGKGLQIKDGGTHIAFAAGTGCLVFLDLVAHLIRKTAKLLSKKEQSMVDEWKF
jgi:NAD(P)H-flavin reductase